MQALSKYNTSLKLMLPILLIAIVAIFPLVMIEESNFIKYLVLAGILTAGYLWLRMTYFGAYNLFFNDKYLILKNEKRERKIGLDQITKIKLTMSDIKLMGFQFYEYEIDFRNEAHKMESKSVFISNLKDDLWDFQDLVRKASPDAQIENHASSWDS
jgi:hypothetical protein